MTDKDFPLKLKVRQLFWNEGLSTRLNVRLAALIQRSRSRTRAGTEEFTDVDVLGIGMSPGHQTMVKLADCKSSPRRIAERIFWVYGVTEFFHGSRSYVVRSTEVPTSSRQLASRLGVVLVSHDDLTALTEISNIGLSENSAQNSFFDGSAYAEFEHLISSIDKRLEVLRTYRATYYWLLEPRRNLQQLVTYLRDFRTKLNPHDDAHFALFMDYVWLYCVALLYAVDKVVSSSVADLDHSLKQYMFGGELELRERQGIVSQLRELRNIIEGEQTVSARELFSVLPPYYSALLELVTRFVRRPRAMSDTLRASEWLNFTALASEGSEPSGQFQPDSVSPKLMNDVAAFLVDSAQLPMDFASRYLDAVNRMFAVEVAAGS